MLSRDTYIRIFLAMKLGDLVFRLEILANMTGLNLIEEVRV